MRVRIECNGHTLPKVVCVETGELVENVQRAEIILTPVGASARLYLLNVEVEGELEAETEAD